MRDLTLRELPAAYRHARRNQGNEQIILRMRRIPALRVLWHRWRGW